jgi:hypothetical protein
MQPRAEEEELRARSTGLHTHEHWLTHTSLEHRSSELGAEELRADQALFLRNLWRAIKVLKLSIKVCQRVNQTLSMKMSIKVCQSKCSTLSFDSQPALKQGMPARTHTTLFEEESDHMVLVLSGCPRMSQPTYVTAHVPRVLQFTRAASACASASAQAACACACACAHRYSERASERRGKTRHSTRIARRARPCKTPHPISQSEREKMREGPARWRAVLLTYALEHRHTQT